MKNKDPINTMNWENKEKELSYQMLAKIQRKWNTHILFVGRQNGIAACKKFWQFLSELKMDLP